jgi:hypothetical protein
MRKCILLSIVLCVFVICIPSTGLSINSGAHIYVTEQVYDSDDVDLLYGCIAPDLSIYVPGMDMWATGFEDTHYNYVSLHPQGWTEPWKRFLIGWETHNEEWGADFYSHIAYSGGQGYVIVKAALLAPFIEPLLPPGSDPELAMLIAHNAVEFAIDVLVQEFLDTNLGVKLLNVAASRSDEDVHRLFNILVAKNKLTDRDTLYQSEAIFRGLILSYSSQLALSSVSDLTPLAALGAQLAYQLYGVVISPDDVKDLLQFALFLCSGDFAIFIGDTIDGIKADLEID